MIQRVQTLYLILAVIAIGLIFFFDICSFTPEGSEKYFIMDLYSIEEASNGKELAEPAYWLWASILLTTLELVLIAAIFTYKKRMKQLKLVHLSYLLEAGSIVLLSFSIDHSAALISEEPGQLLTTYLFAWYMPVVALAFSFLAARGIKKDEELVRSVDRLR
jgi:hypothetical protein